MLSTNQMEMQTCVIHNVASNMQSHNYYQTTYELIALRNKIKISYKQHITCVNSIQLSIIQFLHNLIEFKTLSVQITNCNDIGIEIHLNDDQHIFNTIRLYIESLQLNIKYFSINETIYCNDMMVEKYYNQIIIRSPKSFHQTDDNIRNTLYDIMMQNVKKCQTMYFIGGEMYLYGKIMSDKYTDGYFYSDYKSIVSDTMMNIQTSNIFLVDYKLCTLIKTDDPVAQMIINNGKTGLGTNLCNQILDNNINTLFIISCNQKSFCRDYQILAIKYLITAEYKISTNYSVYLYILTVS